MTWASGLGSINHILGPADENMTIEAPSSRSMFLQGNGQTAIQLDGTSVICSDRLTWADGLGSINHIVGPSDQNLMIQAPSSRNIQLEANGALAMTLDGATISVRDQIIWADSLGALTHLQGPSDQNLTIASGSGQTLILSANTVQTAGANGSFQNIQTATEELTSLSGASATTSGLIPAGSLILGVSVRVTTAITGATDFDIGDGTDVDAFGAAIAIGGGTTSDLSDWTISTPPLVTSATEVVLTANGSNFTAGAVRIVVWYTTLTAPTS